MCKSSASRGVNFDLSSCYKEKAQEGAVAVTDSVQLRAVSEGTLSPLLSLSGLPAGGA